MSAGDKRKPLINKLKDVCNKSTTVITPHEDDVDSMAYNQEELIKFGILCQRMSELTFELILTGEIDDDLMSEMRSIRKAEASSRVKRWLSKLESSMANVLYIREHQSQQTLGDYAKKYLRE